MYRPGDSINLQHGIKHVASEVITYLCHLLPIDFGNIIEHLYTSFTYL